MGKSASPLTSQIAELELDSSVLPVDNNEAPKTSTLCVAFEQIIEGFRFNILITESANITGNLDENTYHQGYDTYSELGPR